MENEAVIIKKLDNEIIDDDEEQKESNNNQQQHLLMNDSADVDLIDVLECIENNSLLVNGSEEEDENIYKTEEAHVSTRTIGSPADKRNRIRSSLSLHDRLQMNQGVFPATIDVLLNAVQLFGEKFCYRRHIFREVQVVGQVISRNQYKHFIQFKIQDPTNPRLFLVRIWKSKHDSKAFEIQMKATENKHRHDTSDLAQAINLLEKKHGKEEEYAFKKDDMITAVGILRQLKVDRVVNSTSCILVEREYLIGHQLKLKHLLLESELDLNH